MEAILSRVTLLPREVGRALQGKGLPRTRECALPEGEGVEGQVGGEVEGEAAHVGGQLELESALPLASPATPVDYQGRAGFCTMTNIINVKFC